MFKGSGLKRVSQVQVDFRLAKVVSATGATGATGAMNEDPSMTGAVKNNTENQKVDEAAVDENTKRNQHLIQEESVRLQKNIAKDQSKVQKLEKQMHEAMAKGDNVTVAKISSELRPIRKDLIQQRKEDAAVQGSAAQSEVVTPQVHAAVTAQSKALAALQGRLRKRCSWRRQEG